MTKKRKGIDEQPITREQAARIVDGWAMPFFCGDESIGDLLLVLSAFTYNRDMTERESLLIAIEGVLMPMSPAACDGLRQLIETRRANAQKGSA